MNLSGRFFSDWLTVLILFIIPGIPSGYCQVYPHVNYSVRQGLANSNVYAMTQDPAGYIWLGTDNGLSRFDGINFRNYTLEQLGLKSYVSSIVATKDGNIIFGSGSSGIYSFDPITETIKPVTKKALLRSNLLIIRNDLLISLHENRGFDFISLNSGEIVFDDIVFDKNTSIKALSMLKLKNETILLGRSDGLYQLVGGEQSKVEVTGLGNTPVYSIFEDKNSILVGGNGQILRIKDNSVTDTICVISGDKNMIRNIKLDTNGNLWFNVWGSKDIYMMSGNNAINVSETAGINGTITGILLESSGTICVSGISNGIYLFGNTHLLVYPESENLPNANIHKIIKTQKNGLLMGTDNGLAYLDSNGKIISSIKHMPDRIQYVRDIVAAPGNQFLIATIDNQFEKSFSEPFSCAVENLKVRYTHSSSIWADSASILIGNWDNKLIQYQLPDYSFLTSRENIFHSTNNTHRINCMQRDEFGRLWTGSQKGLCIINRNGEKFYPKGLFQEDEIYKINNLANGQILVVSNSGFYILDNNDHLDLIKEFRYSSIQGTNCAAITGEHEYLVGTSYGLLFIKNGEKTLMSIQDGMLSENINDIYYERGSSVAWIATAEGLMQVNLELLRGEKTNPLTIRQVTIVHNDISRIPDERNSFNYDSNSFRIKFQAFHYHNPQKVKYQYKVDGGEWLQAPSNEISFASMADGDHAILLRAGLSENNWGPYKIINISILPPFYRTWWFYVITALTSTILILLFIKKQMKVLRLKHEEKTKTQQKIVELQQKALASNLNPHFVFNSLNAIQHFINSKSPAEANDYLAKFARLMRMHLNMAEKSAILLHEEIQRLEFYLSLEQMRFDDKMEWSITIDPAIDLYQVEIPNMIIQPFVENAIWHGIMPSTHKGLISLVIEQAREGELKITITDNGVGFNNQPKSSKNQHESKGTRLIRERLLLLDPSATEVLHFEHLSPGTKVHITLTPKMFRKIAAQPSVSRF